MSIAEEISRIQDDKARIRSKLVDFGLSTSTAGLDALTTAIEGIEKHSGIKAEVQEGTTYTIPQGYHDGSGTVSGIEGGGNYQLQDKTVTPTTLQQVVKPDQGNYGLSTVTVEAIPENYKDVSSVTAEEENVLSGKTFVTKDGVIATGTMPNNGPVSQEIDGMSDILIVSIPDGYTSGGAVSLSDSIEKALQGI